MTIKIERPNTINPEICNKIFPSPDNKDIIYVSLGDKKGFSVRHRNLQTNHFPSTESSQIPVGESIVFSDGTKITAT